MAVELQDLEGKHPSERVQYTFDLTKYKPFRDGTETVAAVTWYVYLSTALTSNIAASIVKASSYTSTSVSVEVGSDTSGNTYYVGGVVTATSGRKYVVLGRFMSSNLGVTLA